MNKRFSIVLPVLNEAGIINPLLDDLETLEGYGECECIVADGSPDGRTIEVITRAGVRCVKSPRGRASQMNAGAALATGEVLIFLHADSRLPRQALALIDRLLAGDPARRPPHGGRGAGHDGEETGFPAVRVDRNAPVGGAFDLRIASERPVLKIIARIASLRSRLTRIPYGDQAIFIRRDCFERLGGYPEISLMEDVALMRRIKREGKRIGLIADPVITSARRWEEEGVLYATLRNWLLLGAYALGASPDRLARYYKPAGDAADG